MTEPAHKPTVYSSFIKKSLKDYPTVKDLIEGLSVYPPNTKVYIQDDTYNDGDSPVMYSAAAIQEAQDIEMNDALETIRNDHILILKSIADLRS
jgi:hypothetical protein